MSVTDNETPMGVVNVRLDQAVKERLQAVAERISARDLNKVTVSDVVRMSIGRSLPGLEQQLGIGA